MTIILEKIKRRMRRFLFGDYQRTYSQLGEDLIIRSIFNALKVENPSYLDIGAHHPTHLSNTHLLYSTGSAGVCVEPDPILYQQIKATRKRDICLNIGIGIDTTDQADFFVVEPSVLNTFSKEEVERSERSGNLKIKKIIKIPLLNVNEIIIQYFQKTPNLISIDVEGLDLKIVQSFDFSNHRPDVFCIETLVFGGNYSEIKIKEINNHMIENGYFLYADTFINSIFVNKDAWQNRKN